MVVCQSEQGFNSKICPQNMFINHSYIKYDVFLGSVISALAEASAKQAANQKAHFIPYRLASKFFFVKFQSFITTFSHSLAHKLLIIS